MTAEGLTIEFVCVFVVFLCLAYLGLTALVAITLAGRLGARTTEKDDVNGLG